MPKLLCLGDSIMQGWDGHETVATPIPQMIGQQLGLDVDNKALGGTSVAAGSNSMVDMLARVDLTQYDYILIGYGANDWGLNEETIDQLTNGLGMLATLIGVAGNNPYVLIDLPIQSFINNATSLDSPNEIGVTQNQVCDAMSSFATKNGYNYYDWRSDEPCTNENRSTTMGDGCLHPTFDTMKKMATRLANYIKQTAGNRPTRPTSPVQPTSPIQPTDPDQPTEPTKPVKKTITLANLADLFKIGDNVSSNINAAVSFINDLYTRVADIYGDLQAAKVNMNVSLSNQLRRPLRDGVITNLLELNSHINKLIRYCKKRGIMDYETGKYAEPITLTMPRRLTTDNNYMNIVNNNWKLIQDTLNQLSAYLQQLEEV